MSVYVQNISKNIESINFFMEAFPLVQGGNHWISKKKSKLGKGGPGAGGGGGWEAGRGRNLGLIRDGRNIF